MSCDNQNNRGNNKISGTTNQDKNTDNRSQEAGGIMCYYGHEPGHIKCNYKKLHNKQQRTQLANVAHTITPFEKTILVFANEFTQFSQY